MSCTNHPDRAVKALCTACQEPFCEDCLVTARGESYCSECKVTAVDTSVDPDSEATIPSETAKEALKYALIGILCFGFILGPIAISKANTALKEIKADPMLKGKSLAMFSLLLG